MKILMPFELVQFEQCQPECRWDRYARQIMPIAKNIEEYKIISKFRNWNLPDHIDNIKFDYFKERKEDIKRLDGIQKIVTKSVSPFIRVREMKLYARKFKDLNVDLIYGLSGNVWNQFLMIELKKLLGVPIVFRMRGNGMIERKSYMKGLSKETRDIIDLYSIKQFDYYVPINYKFARLLLKRGVERRRINKPIIQGVDTELFKPIRITQPEKLTIGYAGRITQIKGIEFLTDLMNRTKDYADYLVCGSKAMPWTPPENCNYYGKIPHASVPVFINACDLMILPSWSEGVSNTILETYACGKVLMLSEHAIPKEIPNFGYKFLLYRNMWIDKIKQLAKDREELRERGAAAREWALNISWDSYGIKMANIFRRVKESFDVEISKNVF